MGVILNQLGLLYATQDRHAEAEPLYKRALAIKQKALTPGHPGLALLWQIYSCRRSLQIHFRQCGHRCGGGRAMSSRMAWRTAGKVG